MQHDSKDLITSVLLTIMGLPFCCSQDGAGAYFRFQSEK